MDYRLLIDLEAIHVLDALPKKVRNRLLDQFHKIRAFPSNYSEWHTRDAEGHRIEICIASSWAIHYWIDAADRHVKILALKPADR